MRALARKTHVFFVIGYYSICSNSNLNVFLDFTFTENHRLFPSDNLIKANHFSSFINSLKLVKLKLTMSLFAQHKFVSSASVID